MPTTKLEDRSYLIGNSTFYNFNRKLCFQARDALYECQDTHENKNKFRCPDELFAYEKWCPGDFQKVNTARKMEYD